MNKLPDHYASWQALISHRMNNSYSDLAYTYLPRGEVSEERSLTYSLLCQRAVALGEYLRAHGVSGEPVILAYDTGLEFIEAFFACLWAGVIAVPVNPPKNEIEMTHLRYLIQDSGSKTVMTTDQVKSRLVSLDEALFVGDALSALVVDSDDFMLDEKSILSSELPEVPLDRLAFIQYTSGSTSKPKGVLVTHGNLLANQEMIKAVFEHNENTVVAGWLPFYHDMGLIGNIMQPFYLGVRCILMSAMSFIKKPIRWLQVISHYGITTSGGPSFGYQLCTDSVRDYQLENIDLSSWTLAFNGAEPIDCAVMEAFSDRFSGCGFSKTAFYPCFGLAEATLIATGIKKGRPYRLATITDESDLLTTPTGHLPVQLSVVGSGSAVPGCEVVVVQNSEGLLCAENQVGEIWVRGPNITKGYWNKPTLTQEVFGQVAVIDGKPVGGFCRTGDLGFMCDGELFVTGRLKELMIFYGKNHYPQDIEKTVTEACDVLRPRGVVACSIPVEGVEHLLLVCEVRQNILRALKGSEHAWEDFVKELNSSIRSIVFAHHGVAVHDVVLVKPRTVPKTSSGKLKRASVRTSYLNGSIERLVAPQSLFAL